MRGRRIFLTRPIPEAGMALLSACGAEIAVGETEEGRPLLSERLREEIARSDVVLSLLTERIDRDSCAAGERLRGIANMAVGYDNVDLAAATELGIPVSNTPDVLTDTTADLAFALLLAAARRLCEAHAFLAAGRYERWGPQLLCGVDASRGGSGRRKVLGIVGFGRIGRGVARRASGFDMEILAHDPHPDVVRAAGAEWVDLKTLLERSDFVSLHVPLTESTRGLIGAEELAAMKPTAVLVNTARGAVVDEAALVRALRDKTLFAAGLDVYEREPETAPGLLALPNVIALPHIGSASVDTRDRMAVLAAEDALRHLRGERARFCLNPTVYEGAAYRARRAP